MLSFTSGWSAGMLAGCSGFLIDRYISMGVKDTIYPAYAQDEAHIKQNKLVRSCYSILGSCLEKIGSTTATLATTCLVVRVATPILASFNSHPSPNDYSTTMFCCASAGGYLISGLGYKLRAKGNNLIIRREKS